MARTDNLGMGAIWDKGLAQPKGQDLGSVNHSLEGGLASTAGRQRWAWFLGALWGEWQSGCHCLVGHWRQENKIHEAWKRGKEK